jgi:cyclic pyranopterin phosphate synthase
MIDCFGRSIHYLRISVTDRCNLRCIYCMPPGGIPWMPMQEILTYEELSQVVESAARLGIRQIRLTGGEPLVRKGLPDLVRSLTGIAGIEEISLTTNGMLLDTLAHPLAVAGLKRVNVSLDTLQDEKFRRITRGGQIERVWRGIAAAEASGLSPLKVNVVVVRGVNDDELIPLASLSMEHAWHIRFIELMPFSNQRVWDELFPPVPSRYLSVQEMHERLQPLQLKPIEGPDGNGPARTYQISGAQGTVGFISPLGEHFCASCNRIRLTADGKLRACLFSDMEVDVKSPLRRGETLDEYFQQVLALKPKGHDLPQGIPLSSSRPDSSLSRTMSQIGG